MTIPHPFGGRKFKGVDGFDGVSTQLGMLSRFIRENTEEFEANAGPGAVRAFNKRIEEFAEELREAALPKK